MKRFWEKVKKTEACWVWTAWKNNKGYGALMAKHPGGGYMNKLAHRISWEMENGPIKDGLCVLHKCDNPSCVRPEHLFLGTRKDNTQDMMMKGRNNCGRISGENHPRSKITVEISKLIRFFWFAERRTRKEIIAFLGVSKHIVDDVIGGRTWKP